MIEHEKNNLTDLKDIDDDSVEELSHSYPMLGRNAKKRILEKCLEKTEEAGYDPNGISVSGTEIYNRPMWRRIAGTAAAAAAAFAVITGAVYLRKTISPTIKDPLSAPGSGSIEENTENNTDNTDEEEYTEAVTTADITQAFEFVTTDGSLYTAVTSSYQSVVSTVSTETTAETTTTDETTTDEDSAAEATTETQAELTMEFLAGKWEASSSEDEREFEFYSDTLGGKVNNTAFNIGLPFTYVISGDTISFRFGGAEEGPDIATVERTDSKHMIFCWEDGKIEELTKE